MYGLFSGQSAAVQPPALSPSADGTGGSAPLIAHTGQGSFFSSRHVRGFLSDRTRGRPIATRDDQGLDILALNSTHGVTPPSGRTAGGLRKTADITQRLASVSSGAYSARYDNGFPVSPYPRTTRSSVFAARPKQVDRRCDRRCFEKPMAILLVVLGLWMTFTVSAIAYWAAQCIDALNNHARVVREVDRGVSSAVDALRGDVHNPNEETLQRLRPLSDSPPVTPSRAVWDEFVNDWLTENSKQP